MKRVPRQALLAFGRRERVVNRHIAEKAAGLPVRRGPGRPPTRRRDRDEGHLVDVVHTARPALVGGATVHVTLRVSGKVPSLRSRRRFSVLKKAFAKANRRDGFRIVHWAVLGNHVHLIAEVASGAALSAGMHSFGLSASRGLNADSVRRAGGKLDPRKGDWSARRGWLGRVFAGRYFAHVLSSLREVQHAIGYVVKNAERHYGAVAVSSVPGVDAYCSLAVGAAEQQLGVVAAPSKSFRYALGLVLKRLGLSRAGRRRFATSR